MKKKLSHFVLGMIFQLPLNVLFSKSMKHKDFCKRSRAKYNKRMS